MSNTLDIDKFIEENLDDIIENKNEIFIDYSLKELNNDLEKESNKDLEKELNNDLEKNEDEEDDNMNDCITEFYEKKLGIIEESSEMPEEEYYFSLLNVFLEYYNYKFDKKDNFFSENSKILGSLETNPQMELFFEAIIEFKNLKNKINLSEIKGNDDDIEYISYYYDSSVEDENKEILNYINDDNIEQIYCLDLVDKKIIAPALIICLDYIVRNNLEKNWNIYNLKIIN